MQLLYPAQSGVVDGAIRLATNQARTPVSLRARLLQPLVFRDAMLALRECVLSRLYVSPQEIVAAQNDPVVTVCPQAVYFEAFSQDESSYARLTLRPDALEGLTDTAYGCTNVAFSEALARGLRELRSSSRCYLEVGREGIALETDGDRRRETRIELPRSWVQGFVEVQAAQRNEGTWVEFAPRELLNLLTYLRKRKAAVSPRSLRIQLEPGQPPRLLVEPWNHVLEMARSRHEASSTQEIRLWGRRRLLVLAELLPHARRVRVLLQGSGAPSFWFVELPGMSLVLGLSPWSAREWTTAEAVAPLRAPLSAEPWLRDKVQVLLEERLVLGFEELRQACAAAPEPLEAALRELCLRGRVLYDVELDLYVGRRLLDEEPEAPTGWSRRQQEARRLFEQGKVDVSREGEWLSGVVRGQSGRYEVRLRADGEQGACSCPFFARFGRSRGPCKHLLAAQLAGRR